ncbi:hypothetical protein SERLA73DRAFT_176037 [Serpula lacrymans var. lacrymans S7.3]|uniref:Acetyltransferase component of pyruvate dehydrogenase complex n=2 Tax=Serpula lacrymans var. lacrymans TaxID=341189 RepID=F8PM63_SERL3|nr:uncharacterized protein SERLADRAFT_458765 [Serpula lacrymans var. lacrymans S7.9]EGO02695.1 hypothetical protein SERLA73DRAFT_176037 [Serpula lacrymans var. lacrymans S7.3]EGO28393.1 hypothetical protein SERLADRAFT_458765 [Serpula lacrymans var. lacrymans S7.9]
MATLSRIVARHLHISHKRNALSKFAMPAMSPTMTDGGIASWKKGEGDSFSAGEVLLEVETDKATIDVEAQDDGVLAKIIVGEGMKHISVGSPIAIIAEVGDDIAIADQMLADMAVDHDSEAKLSTTSQSDISSEPVRHEEPNLRDSTTVGFKSTNLFASPIARMIALKEGIPLSKVKGSGPGGRIIRGDIENYQPIPQPVTPATLPTQEEYTDISLSSMRRTIASRLTQSKQELPHYYISADVDMDQVGRLRELFNKSSGTELKLSLNDFIIKAIASALTDVPEANSAWLGDFIRQYKNADICIAVATPNGLITPILKDVGSKGLAAISSESKDLAKRARNGKLAPHEYQGGTFTVSNLGMYNVDNFTAIINPPQSCILAVGAIKPTIVPAPEESHKFKTVQIMKVTLSLDHRTVDGAVGAKWISAFKGYLEHPLTLLL